MHPSPVTGIIWVGPVYDRGGYGAVSRNFIVGLARVGFPVRVRSIGPRHTELDVKAVQELGKLERADVGNSPVLVIHSTPDFFPVVRAFGVVRKIGCTIFETDRVPAHWVSLCNEMDEIWVPSQFNYQTFAGSGVRKDKLFVLPYAVDTGVFSSTRRRKQEWNGRPFTFLYVFSFGWRKGFDLLLEAFLSEFRGGEAKLVLRAYTEGYQGVSRSNLKNVLFQSVANRIDFTQNDLPEVEVIDTALTTTELIKLYEGCDLYISTDRANGWGMPCMEAMALGKPAATIDWSGSTEFMKDWNSLLIKPSGKLVPVDNRLSGALPKLYAGHRWAEVTVEEVRRVMRWAYEHPQELREIAKVGEEDIRRTYNPEVIAGKVVARIQTFRPRPFHVALRRLRVFGPHVQTGPLRSVLFKKFSA